MGVFLHLQHVLFAFNVQISRCLGEEIKFTLGNVIPLTKMAPPADSTPGL